MMVLRLDGRFDAFTSPALQLAIDDLAAHACANVTVDASALRLIDSVGVRAIMSLYTRIKRSGGQLRVVGIHDQPLTLFRLLKLDGLLADG
jgi:anti-anti-sigma factor